MHVNCRLAQSHHTLRSLAWPGMLPTIGLSRSAPIHVIAQSGPPRSRSPDTSLLSLISQRPLQFTAPPSLSADSVSPWLSSLSLVGASRRPMGDSEDPPPL